MGQAGRRPRHIIHSTPAVPRMKPPYQTSPDPPKIEQDLCKIIPRERWDITSHLLIFHGRRICYARKPNCEGCGLNDVCPSAFAAENVGRKPKLVPVKKKAARAHA